jgi:hypothetical protein
MLKDVVFAEARSGHRLFVRFEDGAEGEVALASLVPFEGVFAALRDPAEFARVTVNCDLGTVVWPSGADLDPDVLYETIARRKGGAMSASERMVR